MILSKMDPFTIFPEEICDEIFNYLTGKDIKNASLVSKHWYNMIGKSKICMKKLCLKHRSSLQFYESILESNRMYQKLFLLISQEEVLKNTKNLRIMRDIVNKFAGSLISITISHDLKIGSDLPKLKEIEFMSVNTTNRAFTNLFASNGLMTKAKSLERLTVRCLDMDEKSVRYFKEFLSYNSSLKMLRIGSNKLIRGMNVDNLKFKLEEFYLTNVNSFLFGPEDYDFFNAQTSSLKIMECRFSKENMAYFLLNAPHLQKLIIHCGHFSLDTQHELSDFPLNNTITKLVINIGHIVHYPALCLLVSQFMMKLQNLQEVETDWMNSSIFAAFHNCTSLKVVRFRYVFYDSSFTSTFRTARNESIRFIKIR